MFPAIREAWRELKEGLGSQPEPLSLKSAMGTIPLELVNAEWNARNGFRNISAAWNGGAASWSGERVSLDTALTHSVVWACRRIISESIAFMPLSMMQSTNQGKVDVSDKPLASALHNAPHDEMTTMEFREVLTGDTVMGGNGFAQIARRSGTGVAQELYPLRPQQVRIERDQKKQLVYLVKDGGSPEVTYTVQRGKPQDILHVKGPTIDGIMGYSVISMARQSWGTANAAERYAATFYANGGRTPYNLKLTQPFKNTTDFDKFRSDWEATYSQPNKVPILEPWLEYQQTGMSLADAQFLGTRQFNIPEICRWFLVSPHLVGDLSRATFSNIEQLALEFVKMTLMAWMVRWEQGMWRCLLTPDEKNQGYYFRHNVNGLLRGDFVSRMAGYASALQNGHLNQDEVRGLEDLNPLPNGEGQHYRVQLNMQTLTEDPASALLKEQASQQPAVRPAEANPQPPPPKPKKSYVNGLAEVQ